jgi:MFS family permease
MKTSEELGDDGYPSTGYAWYVLVILTLAYVVAFLDRQILALLIEPIRHDLGISDTQISLLLGLAFAMFYTLLGIPIGRLADRASRRGIIAVGIALWSVMTAACGLAKNFLHLFLARIGVGVGEAALNPSALSLISDYFPRKKRGRAISFYNMGISVGAGIAMIVGGQIIAWVQNSPPIELPVIGTLYTWQTVFLVVGLPGLVISAMMITVREPVRRDKIRLQTSSGVVTDVIPFKEVARYLGQRWRTYGTHFLGMSVLTIIGYGYFFWMPTMFVRTWNWTIPEISLAYGIMNLVFGPIGVNFGGWLADWLYARGHADGHMRATLIGVLLLIPASVLIPLMPTPQLALIMLVPSLLGGALSTATGAAALMMVAPNQMRGQTTALFYFVINLLGLTLGPTAVAMVTDYGFGYDGALRYSLAIVSGVAGIAAIGFFFWNLPNFRDSMAEVESWVDQESA